MQALDANGVKLGPKTFIWAYREAMKVAPARFLTLRLHPYRYKELYALADIPESIQLGPTPGPMGKQITRVICVKPPNGILQGIAIIEDDTTDLDKLVFELHGSPEIVVKNLGKSDYDPTS